jgi:nucleoside-diphosphate-sugar epimerase
MALTIAITGGTGFLGKHVVAQLIAAGHKVRSLQRKATAPVENLVQISGDLFSQTALDQLCSGADVVLHMAGAISAVSSQAFFDTNAQGTANVVQAAESQSVQRLIYVSTLAARQPQISAYAASKERGEQYVLKAKCETLILRPAAVFGEGDLATLPLLKALMSAIAIIPGRRDARFSMIHVSDLAAICEQAVSNNVTGLREIDDGAGGYGWPDLIGEVQQLYDCPKHVFYLPCFLAFGIGAAGDCWARLTGRPQMISLAKMRELYFPNWVAAAPSWQGHQSMSIAEGLSRTIKWNMANGALPRRAEVVRTPQNLKGEKS